MQSHVVETVSISNKKNRGILYFICEKQNEDVRSKAAPL